jgi:hypothetical protein
MSNFVVVGEVDGVLFDVSGVSLPLTKIITLGVSADQWNITRNRLAMTSSQVEPASWIPMNKGDSHTIQNCLA